MLTAQLRNAAIIINFKTMRNQNCILNPLLNRSLADLPRSAYDEGDDILHTQQQL